MLRTRSYPIKAWTVDLSLLGIGALSGAVGGALLGGALLGGLGSRIAMRFVALWIGVPPAFTVGGSTLLIILGLFLGAALGIIYVIGPRLLPVRPMFKGVVYGLALGMGAVVSTLFLANLHRPLSLWIKILLPFWGV